ncbi:helicase [Clostridium carboxidivorans P7]|uniref:Helicase domain protein n=1 Tax=Clostridium carboxidivorans P7 TaxID=536227 RepID=C6PSD1_9CLOT|nr:helicase-related protein [Clostridium carboxidivorans]AKN32607.1 helicase [Clostridium carboxidivorans P7]EET87809.1 helicase domain protein [Clostridium carboxidivorans P7]EFG90181.1 SNF2 family [Clostridium carboxidivorans P7]
MKQPKILDNKQFGKVGEELKGKVKSGSKLSIISSYFTIFAYKELSKELKKIDKLRFLFTEPSFVKQNKEIVREYFIDKTSEKRISGNEFEIKLRNEMNQSSIAKECAEWIKDKVEIKSLRKPNPAQQRLIYVENKDEDISINGTVDFTSDGLGFSPSTRMDMNTCMYGREFTNHFLTMFNNMWEDKTLVEDVKATVLEHMKAIYKENTPEFIYFVTLYNIFREYLEEITEENIVKTRIGFKNTEIWNKLYKFQKDGVIGAIDKLEKHRGCILADSVGLGKTFSALAVIKYYELRNYRVLVLSPKKLRENWTIYTLNDKRNILLKDRFNYDVLNHTDLTREEGYSGEINLKTVNWSNYDLVVIDESHNFRNNNSRNDKVTRYSKLLNDVIKSGAETKILMLSATPVNNKMNDLKNQINFITEGIDDAFEDEGIVSIKHTLRKAQLIFNKWTNLQEEERTLDTFMEMINIDYFKLLDTVTIARSRKHIEKYYSTAEIGKFPQRLKPINEKSKIDESDEFPSLNHVNKVIRNLNLSTYSPLKYVLPEKRSEYDKKYDTFVKGGQSVFRQVDREESLVSLMRVNILKRMESSINSFGITIAKLLKQIDYTLDKIEKKQFDYDSSLNIENIEIDDPLLEDSLIGNKVKILIQDMDLIKWKQDLEDDKRKLEELLIEAQKVVIHRDAKLNRLKILIENKINNPINLNNKKIIIFSAFADTANYLYESIAAWARDKFKVHTALVTGSGDNKSTLKGVTKKDLNDVLTNFSPISKEREKVNCDIKEEIDILIATDCISEGQNLQDCDYLINYDIHWNPVRIIQRFGRIDRLGSRNDVIQLVNFWPNMELDEYINLEARVTGRMMLLDVSATGEENLIESTGKSKMNDLEYRKKQLKQLQDEVVDLEDIAGGISITDLTMNDFKMDLMEYMKTHKEELEKAPLGMYAVTKMEEDELKNQIKPGVIFTLKQVNINAKPEESNSLYPYYMVYIYEDGTVKYNYIHAKKILDFYKKLCSGNGEILKDIVEEFNLETNNGSEMKKYSKLLEDAIDNIIGKKEEKGVASLFNKGGTTVQKSLFKGIDNFELISFIVIK